MTVMKPGSGFCNLCAKLSDDGTDVAIAAKVFHRERAQHEKEHYMIKVREAEANNNNKHICFDFAEKLYIPHDTKQLQAQFFVTPGKIELFGIGSQAAKTLSIYMFEEGSVPTRQAFIKNQVLTCLHHHIKDIDPNDIITLHADNCASQNKNKSTMRYLCFVVIVKLHLFISLKFMIPGHTKFYCDTLFGLFKTKFYKSDVWGSKKVGELITNSKTEGVTAIHDNELFWYDWASFLDQFFDGVVKDISIKQSFEFRDDGIVRSRDYSDSMEFQDTNLLKKDVTVEDVIKCWSGASQDDRFKPLSSFRVTAEPVPRERLIQLEEIRSKFVKREHRSEFMTHLKPQMHALRDVLVQEKQAKLDAMTEKYRPIEKTPAKKKKTGKKVEAKVKPIWVLGEQGDSLRGKIAELQGFWS
jgi:hypothetical protein